MQSHPRPQRAYPKPQTPGSAKPPSSSGILPISDTAPRSAQTPAPRSLLRAVLLLPQPAQSIPAAAQRTKPSPANLPLPMPSKNCNLSPRAPPPCSSKPTKTQCTCRARLPRRAALPFECGGEASAFTHATAPPDSQIHAHCHSEDIRQGCPKNLNFNYSS